MKKIYQLLHGYYFRRMLLCLVSLSLIQMVTPLSKVSAIECDVFHIPHSEIDCQDIEKNCKNICKLLDPLNLTCDYVCEIETVCNFVETCELLPLEPLAQEVAYQAYRGYINYLAEGSTKAVTINANHINELKEYYESYLSTVTIKDTSKTNDGTGGGTAITDCSTIYFPSGRHDLIDKIALGNPIGDPDDLRWLLHELEHVDQCTLVGGRRDYAIFWTRQFITTTQITDPETLVQDTIAYLKNQPAENIHNAMPMEQDADDVANDVFNALTQKRARNVFLTVIVPLLLND